MEELIKQVSAKAGISEDQARAAYDEKLTIRTRQVDLKAPHWVMYVRDQLEQQFGDRTVLSLNYVGSASHRMDVGGYYNTGTPCSTCASFAARGTNTGQPYPYTVPQKSWDHNAASASYNALQASLVRQFSTELRLYDRLYLEQDAAVVEHRRLRSRGCRTRIDRDLGAEPVAGV